MPDRIDILALAADTEKCNRLNRAIVLMTRMQVSELLTGRLGEGRSHLVIIGISAGETFNKPMERGLRSRTFADWLFTLSASLLSISRAVAASMRFNERSAPPWCRTSDARLSFASVTKLICASMTLAKIRCCSRHRSGPIVARSIVWPNASRGVLPRGRRFRGADKTRHSCRGSWHPPRFPHARACLTSRDYFVVALSVRLGGRKLAFRLGFVGRNLCREHVPVLKAQDSGDDLQTFAMSRGNRFGVERVAQRLRHSLCVAAIAHWITPA